MSDPRLLTLKSRLRLESLVPRLIFTPAFSKTVKYLYTQKRSSFSRILSPTECFFFSFLYSWMFCFYIPDGKPKCRIKQESRISISLRIEAITPKQ